MALYYEVIGKKCIQAETRRSMNGSESYNDRREDAERVLK